MTKNFNNIVTILILLTLTSCDCIQNVGGTVMDIDTKQPLDSVHIRKVNKLDESFTDSLGRFEIQSTSGGIFKCPPMKIKISKYGYISEIMEIKNDENEMIYLKRKKK